MIILRGIPHKMMRNSSLYHEKKLITTYYPGISVAQNSQYHQKNRVMRGATILSTYLQT